MDARSQEALRAYMTTAVSLSLMGDRDPNMALFIEALDELTPAAHTAGGKELQFVVAAGRRLAASARSGIGHAHFIDMLRLFQFETRKLYLRRATASVETWRDGKRAAA